jgi:hypothetical protein
MKEFLFLSIRSHAREQLFVFALKIEGATKIGYRTITIGGVRNPVVIENIDEILSLTVKYIKDRFKMYEKDFDILFRVYGKNGVMGSSEPQIKITSHELCIIPEVVAKTQKLANDIAHAAVYELMHGTFGGILKTGSGNLAFPYSWIIPMGAVYIWNIWHHLPLEDPCEPFRMKVINFPRS